MILLFIILGIILASFYGVVAMRWSNSQSIIKPASHCEYCNEPLRWYDLIPIFSYIIQGGKCRYCHKKLPFLYLGIEILSGLLFGIGYLLYGLDYQLIIYIIIVSLTIIIIVSDFLYLIILDRTTFISIGLTIIVKYIFEGFDTTLHYIITGLIIFAFMYIIKLLGDLIFKRESLGGGDIKLGLFIGLVLGLKLGLVSIIVASCIALPYALYYVAKKKEKEVPFGPFLILATLICFIFANPIGSFINYLFVL